MRFLSRARTPEGELGYAKVQDTRGRVFAYSRKFDSVCQLINHAVSNRNGYGDGYWRTAGKRDGVAVRAFLEKWSQEGNLARTTFVSADSSVQIG